MTNKEQWILKSKEFNKLIATFIAKGRPGYYIVPDFCNSLDAMRIAEQTIDMKNYHLVYLKTLSDIVDRDWMAGDRSTNRSVACASSSQRAEAFMEWIKICEK